MVVVGKFGIIPDLTLMSRATTGATGAGVGVGAGACDTDANGDLMECVENDDEIEAVEEAPPLLLLVAVLAAPVPF